LIINNAGEDSMSTSDESVPTLEKGSNVPCLLVPLLDRVLLLPSVAVAEMAPMRPVGSVANAPKWLLGFYEWRGARVPVLSFESINGGPLTPLNPQGRMAVLNNTGVNDKLPFVAVPTQGIPRMVRVNEEDIVENTDRQRQAFELLQVKLGMEQFVIPNISALEKACLDTGLVITSR